MKKRMFITTIVMMLVLAVALTTSSLAWFSASNASVTAAAATFKAKAASSNINLKIAKTTGSWGNTINLASGDLTSGTMEALIPTEALVPTYGDGYVWNPAIKLNGAKVGSESNFIIDSANPVSNPEVIRGASNGYYYDYFYIHNADSQTPINKLNFKVTSKTSVEEGSGDTACRAYAIMILFKSVDVEVGEEVPANAAEHAGDTVVAQDTEGEPSSGNVKANTERGEKHYVYLAWVPFAAFSYSPAKSTDEWQYADLDKKTEEGTYAYNNADILSLSKQVADADFASETAPGNAFTLDSTSLKTLNSKSGTTDNDSVFSMLAKETFRVDFYYWLDGLDLNEFKDETQAEVSIQIEAPEA